jgi:release factor glutamine methyltransferase
MEQIQLFSNLLKILEKDLIILPDKNEENAENTLRALWHFSNDNRVSPILAEKQDLPKLSTSQIALLEEAVKTRLSGVPLAHITERQHFMGLDYILNKGLYIPRKETELLAKTAIETIQNDFVLKKNVKIMDLCTGIGTVALAIAHYCSNSQVYGSDIYEPAIEAANINARHFHLDTRSTFFNANLFEPFENLDLKDNTHLIVSAPPYISSLKVKQMASEIANHEPEEAFDAGPFGLSVFNQLISIAPEYLMNNGYLIFECGLGQGDFLVNRLSKNQRYGEITLINDENANGRVLKAKKIS